MRTSLAAPLALLATAAAAAAGMPAFPGAEGFGAASAGGRGGKAILVSNLNPSGPGSLQAACDAQGPRIVVFRVSGVIRGNVAIRHPRITIAGQTAPGAGITIEGMLVNPYRIQPNLHDVTIRFLRVRPPARKGKWAGGDCLQLTDIDRLIIDHVSCSWGSDENMDLCNSRQISVQWSAIEQSDTRGHTKGPHNYGMILGYAGRDATIHHNLFAHHARRAPLCGLELLDHRNNVIYNMGAPLNWHPTRMNQQRPGQPFRANIIANTFKAGPNARRDGRTATLDRIMSSRSAVHAYTSGNVLTWLGKVAEDRGEPRADQPWPAPPVATQEAGAAYRLVLAHAGCLPRDAVSLRTLREVRDSTGQWGRHEPLDGLMEGLEPEDPAPDADADGMPDAWEKAHRLDPTDPADAIRIVPKGASKEDRHAGYTWIEFYINALADRLIAQAMAEPPDKATQ